MSAAVAVAIVSWNTRDLLEHCLRSLGADVEAGRAETWVVDNGSSDGSPALVRERFPYVHLVEPGENLGFGRAVNLVAERASADWIAPSNADIELTQGALEALLETGERHPEAAAIAPRLLLPDGSTQHSVNAFPTLPYTLVFNLALHRLNRRLADELCLHGFWNPERGRSVDWAVGAFLIVRRQAFRQVGGFDERHWMYAEDLDLGWRLHEAGWTTRYEPRARVRHHVSAATEQAFGDEITERFQAESYAWMLRRRGLARTWLTAAISTIAISLRLAALAPLSAREPERYRWRRERARTWLRAHMTGLRSPRAIASGARKPGSR